MRTRARPHEQSDFPAFGGKKRRACATSAQFRKSAKILPRLHRLSFVAQRRDGCASLLPRARHEAIHSNFRIGIEVHPLYRGTIWIDAQDFAVTRIEAEPARNPSFWTKKSQIRHRYQKIGEFYLPALNQTVTDVRLGGKAVLTIRYHDYKLNPSSGERAGGK